MTVIRVAVAFVGTVLIASLLALPIAMWTQGDSAITVASAWTVAQLSLVLGLAIILFLGTLWLLGGLVAWAVMDE